MERIDTRIERVRVEIEGRQYALAEKTVGLAKELIETRRKLGSAPGYRLWMAELRLLLGRRAVKRLFPHGDKENIDRMQRIHGGVMRAFEHNAMCAEEERLLAALREICSAGDLPVISRADAQGREA